MTRDRSDAFVVTYDPVGRAARRLTFEPHSEGGYLRVERVQREDGTWHPVGRERVNSVDVETPD